MTRTETTRFVQLLTDKLVEVRAQLLRKDEIRIEISPEELEERLFASQRDLALTALGRASRTSRQIEAALRRLRNNSFGICLRCESEISRKRLKAIPWAAYCVECQQVVDRTTVCDGEYLNPAA